MENRDFGGLIRRSRERLGLSQSRVAELIGRSQGTVRAWERGRSVPGEATVVASLAAVLDIAEDDLFDAAGLALPASPPAPTLEESLASIAPSPSASSAGKGAEIAEESGTPSVGTARFAVDPRLGSPEGEARPEGRWSLIRSYVASLLSRKRRSDRPVTGRPVVISPAVVRPSYLEDPEQRMVYRLRTLFTVVGIAALAVVLLWAAGNVVDALGRAWETLTEGL